MTGDRQLYDSFVRSCTDAPPFLHSEWLNAFGTQWDYVHSESNGEVMGVWPFQRANIFGMTISRALPLTPYLGPVIRKSSKDSACEIMLEMLGKIRSSLAFFNQTMPPHMPWISHLRESSIDLIVERKQVLELDPSMDWNHISPRRRRYIRALTKQGEFRESTDAEHLNRFSLQAHKRRKTKQPFDASTLQRLLSFQAHNAKTKLLYLVLQDNIVAGALIVLTPERCYLLCTGRDETTAPQGSLNALVWHCIQMAAQKSKVFDFHGSMVPGIAQFNKSFGAHDEEYFRMRRSNKIFDLIRRV